MSKLSSKLSHDLQSNFKQPHKCRGTYMQVALKGSTTFALSIPRINAALFVISVTGIPCSPVLAPRTHTDPAEFMFTFLASHMAVLEAEMLATFTPTSPCRDERQTTYLHPPFFSMVLWQLLHSFVLLLIQFAVSLSSWHFLSHILATPQITGRWSLSTLQPKQNLCSLPARLRLPCAS